jgi:hypothetical protein
MTVEFSNPYKRSIKAIWVKTKFAHLGKERPKLAVTSKQVRKKLWASRKLGSDIAHQ